MEQLLEQKENLVTCQSSVGTEIRATLLRISRHLAVFEIYNTQLVLRLSEVLQECRIVVSGRPVYLGRAIVTSIVHTGTLLVCEASLEDSWVDAQAFVSLTEPDHLRAGFESFLRDWEKAYRITPEYKILVADMHTYLSDMRLWLDQVELGVRSAPSGDRLKLERQAVSELSRPVIPALNALFEKFETLVESLPPDQRPAHHSYIKRSVHPLVLCSPFAYRTFHKPLGYAGDYEMVNMLLRDPQEGGSIFAKVLNCWFISQPPAQAHRNRIRYLTQKLVEETVRVKGEGGGVARIYNLGCGPAQEIQDFFAQSDVSDYAEFVLLDFNDETLQHSQGVIEGIKRKHARRTPIQWVKKSVVQILKGAAKVQGGSQNKHDFVYCAGLFDYLPDRVCKDLMNIFYGMLAPGGLLVTTNVDTSNPIRHMLDFVLEWHLLYRQGHQMRALKPDDAPAESVTVCSDQTGVNIFLEVRKPRS